MIVTQIRDAQPQMRPSEQRVAEVVLADPASAVFKTISALSVEAGVSEPTVLRFCRALGFSSFRAFRIHLAQSVAAKPGFASAATEPGVGTSGLVQRIFGNAADTLRDVKDKLDPDAIDRAAAIVAEARKLDIYGVGASAMVAQDAQHKFFRLSLPAAAYADPHFQVMSASTLRIGDAVIAVSHTGRTQDILTAVEAALGSGAQVIAVCRPGSPLAGLATVAIGVPVAENTDAFTPMTSRLAHLVTLDVLATAVAERMGPELGERLARLKARLRDKRVEDRPRGRR